jgi:hypothetical protein
LPEVSERERARIALVSLLERAQSGDVVLFSGTRASSQRIRRLTQSAFSHVAMVVRDAELAPGALLWQASSGPHSGVLRGMERRAGIQLNPLGEALHDYLGECPGARFVHRSLHTRADPALLCKRQAALNDLVRRLDGGPYTPDMDGLYVLGLMELGTAPPNEFFCAGAVAEALMEMGILTRTFQHWQYTPRDFSEEQSELPFAQTEERYAPEVQIEL